MKLIAQIFIGIPLVAVFLIGVLILMLFVGAGKAEEILVGRHKI